MTFRIFVESAHSVACPESVPLSVVAAEDETSQLYYWLRSSFVGQLRCEAEVKRDIEVAVASTLSAHKGTIIRNDVDANMHTAYDNIHTAYIKHGTGTAYCHQNSFVLYVMLAALMC